MKIKITYSLIILFSLFTVLEAFKLHECKEVMNQEMVCHSEVEKRACCDAPEEEHHDCECLSHDKCVVEYSEIQIPPNNKINIANTLTFPYSEFFYSSEYVSNRIDKSTYIPPLNTTDICVEIQRFLI